MKPAFMPSTFCYMYISCILHFFLYACVQYLFYPEAFLCLYANKFNRIPSLFSNFVHYHVYIVYFYIPTRTTNWQVLYIIITNAL